MRLIDADNLKIMIEAKADTVLNGKEAFLYVAKWLDFLQPVDAEPVRHAKNAENYPSLFRCSACGLECGDTYFGDSEYRYCPGCGAKMEAQETKEDKK